MNLKKILDHPEYNTIMFISMVTISLLILFSFVNFMEPNKTLGEKTITAFAIENQNQTISREDTSEKPLGVLDLEGEIYTTQAWSIFYIILVGIIILVSGLSVVLKNTIKKNITEEDKQRELI